MSREPAAGDVTCGVIEEVMAVLGRAWAGAVLEAMLGGAQRFSEIGRAVPGITDAVLSARLKELCAHGLVERIVEAGPPVAVSYHLTPAGRDVEPVLDAIRAFGLRHPRVGARS